jgi:hypothetical protein
MIGMMENNTTTAYASPIRKTPQPLKSIISPQPNIVKNKKKARKSFVSRPNSPGNYSDPSQITNHETKINK